MSDPPQAGGPDFSPDHAPAPAGPPPGPPVGPAPVFGWYIPAGPPGYGQAAYAPSGYGAPPGDGMAPGYAPQPGYGMAPAYGMPGGYGVAPYPAYPGAPLPPYGPAWYPPGPGWGPVRPPSFSKQPHAEPQPYLRLMRTVNYRWWRPLLGLLAFLGCYFVAAVVILLAFIIGGMDPDVAQLGDLTDPTTLALTNAVLIVAIPSVWVAWTVHTERIGWSSSVLGRIRWRLMWRYGLLALAVLGLGMLIALAFPDGLGTGTGFDARSYVALVLVVLLSTPLQSAAEEYFFRGYASQALASWLPPRTTGAVLTALITATLFSLIHVPGDFLTFFDRFAFGLAASSVVWLTGGLEAAIALHAANNVWIFLVVGALGVAPSSDIEAAPGTGVLIVAVDVLVMSLYVWLVAKTRKRWHPEILSRAAAPLTDGTGGYQQSLVPVSSGAAPAWGGQPPTGPAPYAPAPPTSPS